MVDHILERLSKARWQTAFRTYGSSHATLIGLLVDWWINEAPERRWSLEGGPSYAYHRGGKGGGICDAILGEDAQCVGVVEVEGTRYEKTLKKLGSFFTSSYPDLKTLKFGLFLAYSYSPRDLLSLDQLIDWGKPIAQANPDKILIVFALEKEWETDVILPRAKNEYYKGSARGVSGAILRHREVIARSEVFSPGSRLEVKDNAREADTG